ncbi:DUF1416 domain-containing protein [Streptosporangium subroseum]|jgi:hypothetical protein|uniref:DUF1416 domain-containing protein n=1 Tax=Streptosporangium subroseum TaxID=106412 RepID=A0A239NVQ0_9ACTN|nr:MULTISPECIES: DUF1416 domain-containing protein [Streptosporangium]AWS40372.1 DUF1416 domain-containing protein [Streptosporangium sp. 'caverna']WSA16354.1 DUF1416 domain-containing protein [Streptosporangium subroseum]SNT58936.1 Protein of unknown function [Streptosporangium subroseum]
MTDGCAAPEQTVAIPAGIDLSTQAVIQGVVSGTGTAYARLLDHAGEFTGEVVVSDEGIFRFFAAPGDWTVRIIAGGGFTRDIPAQARLGEVTQLAVAV